MTNSEPLLGIFWFFNGQLVFFDAIPVSDGIRYGDAITGKKDHADYWEDLRSEGLLNVLPEKLRQEYFSIPRGRVVYHVDSDRFFVYHGNNIKKKDLRQVIKKFCLPKDKTVFEQDLHYCDYSEPEWKKLFR